MQEIAIMHYYLKIAKEEVGLLGHPGADWNAYYRTKASKGQLQIEMHTIGVRLAKEFYSMVIQRTKGLMKYPGMDRKA